RNVILVRSGSRRDGRCNTSGRSVILVRCDSGKEMSICMRGKRWRCRQAGLLQCVSEGLDGSETQLWFFGKGFAYDFPNFWSLKGHLFVQGRWLHQFVSESHLDIGVPLKGRGSAQPLIGGNAQGVLITCEMRLAVKLLG